MAKYLIRIPEKHRPYLRKKKRRRQKVGFVGKGMDMEGVGRRVNIKTRVQKRLKEFIFQLTSQKHLSIGYKKGTQCDISPRMRYFFLGW